MLLASLNAKVDRVVALSTDKASNLLTFMAPPKASRPDKLFVASNVSENGSTSFAVVRYGNVMGSRGSVIPFFISRKDLVVQITHPDMTRFMISLENKEACLAHAFDEVCGGKFMSKKSLL